MFVKHCLNFLELISFLFWLEGCTDIQEEVQYLCEWQNKSAIQLVPAKEAKQKFPLLVVGFLEAKIVAPRYDFASGGLRNITRSFRAQIERNGVSIEAKTQIERNMALEKCMLRKPSKVIDRRHTVGVPLKKTPPVPRLIPLRSILKTPSKDVGNKRKSMFPRVTFSPSTSNNSASN